MLHEVLTYSQFLNVIGISLEIFGFLLLLKPVVEFIKKLDKKTKSSHRLREAYDSLMFRYGVVFVIMGLVFQMAGTFADAYNFDPNWW